MKVKFSILFFVVAFMFVGCNKTNDPSNGTEQSSAAHASTDYSIFEEPEDAYDPSNSAEQNSTAYASTDYSIFEEPEDAYTAFLNNLYSGDEDPRNLYEKRDDWERYNNQVNMEYYFALKDLDNDGVQELLIRTNWGNITAYTFKEGLNKVGSCNFPTGTERLFFSDNPTYPGMFNYHLGGGLEHYGYMTIKDNQLTYEELWNEDYSEWRENRIEEFSKDKGLINESKILYSEGNDIEWLGLESLDMWPLS